MQPGNLHHWAKWEAKICFLPQHSMGNEVLLRPAPYATKLVYFPLPSNGAFASISLETRSPERTCSVPEGVELGAE